MNIDDFPLWKEHVLCPQCQGYLERKYHVAGEHDCVRCQDVWEEHMSVTCQQCDFHFVEFFKKPVEENRRPFPRMRKSATERANDGG